MLGGDGIWLTLRLHDMEGGMHATIGMLNDFRYAFRALRSSPGFALTAIVSVALGAGSNSAIFSLADGLLFRPLPVPRARRC
jgi:hypothetical protein